MAEDQNQSDFDELLGMYSGETTEGDSSSDSSNDFDDLLSIYSEEDVKKKGTTSESSGQDGDAESIKVDVKPKDVGDEKREILDSEAVKYSDLYDYIDRDLIDRGDENQVARDLQDRYEKYGFDFEATGIGDAVKVTKNKGTLDEVTEVFDLDPAWYNLTSEEGEAKRMKDWFAENTSEEDFAKYTRAKSNAFVVDAPNPQDIQPAQEGDQKKVMGPTGPMGPTGADGIGLQELDRQIFPENKELGLEITTEEGVEGVTGVEGTGIITSTMQEAYDAEAKAAEEARKSKDAMLMAVGMEEGKTIASITGNLEGAVIPGQESIVAEQTRSIIEEKRKKSGNTEFQKGEDNYYANIALNYYDQMNPNKAKRIRDEIENNPNFFEENQALQKKSSNLVKEGLDISYTVFADQRDDLLKRNKDLVQESQKLEDSIMNLSQKVVGDKFVGSQEEFDKYVADFNTLKLMYDSPEFKEMNKAQTSVNAIMQDYETNPDVQTLEVLEIFKNKYQQRTDAAYEDANTLYQVMNPVWDGLVGGGLKTFSALASFANNINPDEKYDYGDKIDDYFQMAADTYAVRNPAPTKFAREFYEKAANVDGFEVILKDGEPTGMVYDSSGYKAHEADTEYILKKFNSSPGSYDEYSNFNVRAAAYSSTPIAMDMIMTLMPIGGAVTKAAQYAKFSQRTSAMIGTFSAIVVQSQDDFYETARDLGATDSEALGFALAQSAAIGAIALVNPVEAKALMATVGSSSRKGLARQYVRNLTQGKGSKESFRLAVEATTKQTLTGGLKTLGKEGIKEGFEETLEIPGQELVSNVWAYAGGVDATSEMEAQEAINTFALATLGSLPFAVLGLKGRGSYQREMLYAAVSDIEGTRSFLEESKGKTVKGPGGITRRIDEEYINEHISQLEELKRNAETFFTNPDITDADKEAITDLVSHRSSLQKQLKEGGLTPAMEVAYKETMSKIDMSLNQYVNKKEGEPFYILENKAVSKEFLEEQMKDPKWVEGYKAGRWMIRIQNDSDMNSKLSELYDGKKTEEQVPAYDAPTVFTDPTEEKYATVNRNDGKGDVTLTKPEYEAEQAKFEVKKTPTEAETRQEITDYIGTTFSKARMEQKVDPVLERANNAEEINENELDGAIDALFEEIDNVQKSDLSESAKESIITELYQAAEKLDNYEFTTETRTKKVTKTRAVKNLGAFAEKASIQNFWNNVEGSIVEDGEIGGLALASGDKVTFINDDGTIKVVREDVSDAGLDVTSEGVVQNQFVQMSSIKIEDGDITFDENGNVESVVVTDENGLKIRFEGDAALDLAIMESMNKIGTVPDAALFQIISEEVEVEEEVLKEQKDDTKTTEQERVDSEEQGRQEDTGEVQEQREGETEGETDPVLQEEVAPDTQESLDQKKSDLTTSKARGKNFKRDAINRVKKAMKALSKIAPDVKFVVHTDVDSYAAVHGDFDKDRVDNGFFSSASNTIHINLDSINDLDGLKTIAHEVFHAVLYNRLGLETGRTDFSVETKRMLDAVMGAAKISKKLKKELDGVIGDMDLDEDLELSEETLAELAGILSANYESLQLTTKKAIMKWVNDLAKKLNISKEIFKGVNTEAELIDMLNVLSGKVAEGEVITEEDVVAVESVRVSEEEVGESGATGKVNIKRRARGIKAPSVKEDPRPFARLIQDIDLREFSGMDFITNMYDYTTAGKVDLGGGFTIDLFGGKDYVPFMMEKQGLKLGDKSNLAAFNSEENAEGFIRNAMNSGAKLFMPHSGTLDQSWQFQHAIFEQVSNFALDNNILSNEAIIDLFNKTLESEQGRKNFKTFKDNYAEAKGEEFTASNFDQFLDNPKELIELLDADKNYSPKLRKDVSNKIVSIKEFQQALGIKNKQQFFDMIISPLNKGVKGGEIMGAVDFDPSTFEVKKTKPGDIDHHPSFGYTLLAKINGIYQPTEFYQSDQITDSYTKYNKSGKKVSKRETAATRKQYEKALQDTRTYKINKDGKRVVDKGSAPFVGTFEEFKKAKFRKSNVSSSAGSAPKVATVGKDKFRRRKAKEEAPAREKKEYKFKIPKKRIHRETEKAYTFLTSGYGGEFINLPKSQIQVRDTDPMLGIEGQPVNDMVEVTVPEWLYKKNENLKDIKYFELVSQPKVKEEKGRKYRRRKPKEKVELDNQGYRKGFEKDSKTGKIYGYKVMTIDDSGNLKSGADSRQILSKKKGEIHSMRGDGIFITNDPKYAEDYYSFREDLEDPKEAIIKYEFDESDIVTGKLQLNESQAEISVKKGKVVEITDILLEEEKPTKAKEEKGRKFRRRKPKINWTETKSWEEQGMKAEDAVISTRVEKVRQGFVDFLEGIITFDQARKIQEELSPIGEIREFFGATSRKRIDNAIPDSKANEVRNSGDRLKIDKILEDGMLVETRLDIPAYKDKNAWVVTIHEPKPGGQAGKAISYTNAVRLKSPKGGKITFSTDPAAALSIATAGQDKSTIARIQGELVNFRDEKGEVIQDTDQRGKAAEAWFEENVYENPEWVQVGMNPFRRSDFWDRNTQQTITAAEEMIQIGGLVYVKNPTYAENQGFDVLATGIVYGNVKLTESQKDAIAKTHPQIIEKYEFNIEKEKDKKSKAKSFKLPQSDMEAIREAHPAIYQELKKTFKPKLSPGQDALKGLGETKYLGGKQRVVDKAALKQDKLLDKYNKLAQKRRDATITENEISELEKIENKYGIKFRRKKKASDVVTNQSINDDIKAEQKETSRYRRFRRSVRSFIKAFADYQYDLKDALKKGGLESAVTRLINVKGASAFAKFKFDQVRDQIFGNLTIDERIQLDRYIAARRAVVANEERQRRIQQAEVDLINGDITSKEYDKILEQEQNGNPILTEGLTPEEMMEDMVKLETEFPHFVKRADKYFEVFQSQLDEDLKNGLISEELYNSLTGLDYSPRVFLKYIYNIDGILDGDENWENKLKSDYGMSADNIRRLKEGIASSGSKVDGYLIELMKDSEVLLANYLNARAKKNMMNEATKKLAEGLPETFERLQELKDKKDTGVKLSKSEEVELNSLEAVARTFSETRNSKKGLTSELIYYVDGKKQSIYTTADVRSQWFDNKPNQMDGPIKKWLASTTGSNLLKKMATGLNPLFVVTNAPRDYFQVLAFTDTYSKTRGAAFVPFRMAYLLKDFVKAWKSIHTKDKEFEQAVEDGLMLDFLYKEGRDEQPIKTVAKQAVDAVTSGKPKDLGQKRVFEKIFEKALYFNEVSEVGFRMAIRDRVMKEEMRDLNKRYPDVGSLSPEEKAKYDAEVADIRALATSKAREYMDFSTGGSITKALDPALPYLNAAAVGAFASTKYMKENPGKFALDLIQIAGGSVGVVAGSSVAAIAMFRPDDDDDELNKLANQKFSKNYEDLTDAQQREIKPSALDIYIDQKRKIPSYVSDRYFVIFTGKIDKNGGYQYIKVAKNQGLAPFLSLTEDLTMNALREYQGESKVYSNMDIFLNANRNLWNNYNAFGFNPADVFTGDEPLKEMYKIPAEIVARNPFIGGSIEIATNYDFFRGKPINYGATKGSLPKYRGYKDDSLEGFYIDIARSTGLGTGKDIKYAVEKYLTSPSTNPGMAIAYGIGENLSITSNTFNKTQKRGMNRITEQVGKRFLGYTNPNYEPNMIEREKNIQEYIKKTTGDEVGRNEMISAYAETVSEVLLQDDSFISLVNDPDMTGNQKKVFIEGAIDKLIDTDPSLKTYLKTVGLKELDDKERRLLESQIDKNFTIGEIKGANVYKFRQAIRKSSDTRQLARNFLLVSQGMDPDDTSFRELEREFKDYYTALRADTKTSKLAKNLPSDFNRLYREEYKAFEADQQQ